MRKPRRRGHKSRRFAAVAAAMFSPMAVVLPAIVAGADSAAAAPAAGYSVTRIPVADQYAYAVAVDSATNTTYFADEFTNEVSVVADGTNAVTATIPLSGTPRGIAVDPVTDTVYVSLLLSTVTGTPAVAVINGANNTVIQTIPLPTGSSPSGVAIDSSTGTAYVAEATAAALAVIKEASNSVTTISMGSGTRPYQLAVDATSGVVWVADLNSEVQEVSEASQSVTRTIGLGGVTVESIAVNPASSTVYTATLSDGVAVINETSGTIASYINIAPVYDVTMDPSSGTVFASTYAGSTSGTTWVIDASSNTIVDTIQRGGLQLAVNTATGSVYAAAYAAQTFGAWVLTPSTTNAWSPVIKSITATFTAGTSGSYAIVGTALPAATYSETGQMPTGITLSPSGILSGTPATGTGGAYSITITATNGISPAYSQAFTLVVDEAPSLTAPATETFQVGTPVSVPIQTTGYPAPLVTATSLPAGVSLIEPSGGSWELSGTPSAGSGGVYTAQLSATNGFGGVTTSMAITVLEAPTITSAPATTFLADTPGLYVLSARGYPAPTFAVTGNLPTGVDLAGGQLVEQPSLGVGAVGVHQFTVSASNSSGTVNQPFTLTVRSPVAVGAEGSDGQLWVQAPQLATGWQPLGGKITAPPAVAAAPATGVSTPAAPLFIATGTDKQLYVRSLTVGWQLLGTAAMSCVGGPGAVVTGTAPNLTLTVACRGQDNALWVNSAALPAAGLPQLASGWTSLGGVLSAGPAATPVGGTLTFFVRGTNGEIYTRTMSTGYTPTAWFCAGQPAAATQAASGTAIFACQGTDQALREATNTGSGWTALTSLGGSLIGGPAVAANGDETIVLAEGTDHAGWQNASSSGWTNLGGNIVGGIGAVTLA